MGLIYKLVYVTCDAVMNTTLMHLLMVGQLICSYINYCLIKERSIEMVEYGNLPLPITHLDSYVPTLLLYVTYDVCVRDL